ncbi:hypothetical protein [Pseudomonas fluorescens]
MDIFSVVPLALITAVLSAVIALTGVFISNRSNLNRLVIQLDHDSKEKSKERAGKLRQEAYLNIAEELTRINTKLGSLAFKEAGSVADDNDLSGLMSATIKCQLVAEQKTAHLISSLSQAYAELTAYSVEKLTPLRFCNVNIKFADEGHRTASEQADNIVKEITSLDGREAAESEKLDRLFKKLEACEARAMQCRDEREQQYVRREQLLETFVSEMTERLAPVEKLYSKTILAIRSDLGFSV